MNLNFMIIIALIKFGRRHQLPPSFMALGENKLDTLPLINSYDSCSDPKKYGFQSSDDNGHGISGYLEFYFSSN